MGDYVTLDEFKDLIQEPGTDRDGALTDVLDAAERDVEEHCGRVFTKDASASQRVIRPIGNVVDEFDGQSVLLDDIASVTGLVVETGAGGTWTTLASSAYETYPLNSPADGRPITSILRLNATWTSSSGQRVRVTAVWGWPEVPAQVKQAVLLQANRLWKRKGSPEGVAGSSEWGVIRVGRIDPDVETLLAPLRKPGLA